MDHGRSDRPAQGPTEPRKRGEEPNTRVDKMDAIPVAPHQREATRGRARRARGGRDAKPTVAGMNLSFTRRRAVLKPMQELTTGTRVTGACKMAGGGEQQAAEAREVGELKPSKWKRRWRCPRCRQRFRLRRGTHSETDLCPGCWKHRLSRPRKPMRPERLARLLRQLGYEPDAARELARRLCLNTNSGRENTAIVAAKRREPDVLQARAAGNTGQIDK